MSAPPDLPAWLQFVIISLAAYRLTRLVTTDEITAPLREWVWRRRPPESSRIGYLLACDWCTGIWVGSLLVVGHMIAPVPATWVCLALAVAATVGILSERMSRG